MIRKIFKRGLALLLAAALLLGLPMASGAQEPTDAELIDRYAIADTWSRDALLFAVRKGLLKGSEKGQLLPADSTTRAECAAILNRILRTQAQASLEEFSDVSTDDWYYTDLAKSVALGVFNGHGNGKLTPQSSITREEAFAVLARTLGLQSDCTDSLYRFKDLSAISSWARPSLAAMAQAGYINGDNKGYLNPKSRIERQELAQVLYNIFSDVTDTAADELNGKTFAATAIADHTTVHGDLLLSSEAAELTFENLTVDGRLIIQGTGHVSLNLTNCTIGELVLLRPANLNVYGHTGSVVLYRDATLCGEYGAVEAHAYVSMSGHAQTLTVCAGSLRVEDGAGVDAITVRYTAQGAAVQLNGTANTVWLRAENARLDGTGSCQTLHITKAGCTATCQVGETLTSPDQGLAGVSIRRSDDTRPSAEAPVADISVAFSGVDNSAGFVQDGVRSCRLTWFVNGVCADVRDPFALSDGLTDTRSIDFGAYMTTHSSVPVLVCLSYEGQTVTAAFRVRLDNSVYEQACGIKTGQVKATLKYSTGLYTSCGSYGLSGWKRTLTAGTQVTYHAYWYTSYAYICLSDGTYGWVDYSAIRISGDASYTTTDYPTAVKECWANEVKGYSSSSGYLVWVSLYTQRVNIFRGSKGNWSLQYAFPCASGSNYTPTFSEVTTLRYKTMRWNFGSYYVHHVSVIDDGGRAFHSRTYMPSGGILDTTMGKPVSHGCIRMEDAGCTWIYNNIPVGTTVVVW